MPPLPQSARFDLESIRRSVGLFLPPDAVTELRIPKSGNGVMSGYFSDPKLLTDAILEVNNKVPGIYVTLNPVPPDALARSDNHLTRNALNGSGTKDSEILHRYWMLMDFDPVRLRGISSTDAEHEESIATAQIARDALASENWPAPALGDSGNGGHLLYAIDLPNDQESADLIRAVLQAAAQRWSTPRTKVDTTVFNASRISKVYGTFVKKGDSTAERPHRLSRILDVPNPITPVPIERLRALAAEVRITPPPSTAPKAFAGSKPFDIPGFISKYALQVKSGPEQWESGTRWVLDHCPFNPEHGAKDAAIFLQDSGRPGFKCFHDSCADNHWPQFRRLYEADRTPKPYTNGHAAPHAQLAAAPDSPVATAIENGWADRLNTARTLVKAVLEAPATSLWGSRENPAPYIVALAALGEMEQHAARRLLKEKFKKDFQAKEWDAQLSHEIRKRTDQAQQQTPYILNHDGAIRVIVANAITMMSHLPITWNSFSHRAFLKSPAPWGSVGNWVDYDDTKAAEWCQHQGLHIPPLVAMDACNAVARSRPHHHPVIEYLQALKWDRKPRLDRWLHTYLGTVDNAYTRSVGAKWAISAVKRVILPGCQADYTLVFEGLQGKRKSTALGALAGREWFTDDVTEIGTKDSAIQIQGKWIVELAELDAVRKSDITTIKAWLVRRNDHFRPPYGRRAEDFARQNVFAASTNKNRWGMDESGLRRFWPVRCAEFNQVDVDGIVEVRDQLWAEAYYRYAQKEEIWLSEAMETEAAVEQHDRQEIDPWTELIETWAVNPTMRTADINKLHDFRSKPGIIYLQETLWNACGIPEKDWNRTHRDRVAHVLRLAGWTTRREPRHADGSTRMEYWVPPGLIK